MKLRIALVPSWRHAHKWFSMQCAAVLVVLGAVQTVAQQVESSSYLADVTRQTWYHATMTVVAALTIFMRLVHQPVAEVSQEEGRPCGP